MSGATWRRWVLLASAGSSLLIANAAVGQTTSRIGEEADQPGQPGPAGPAGQATQGGPAVPAARGAPAAGAASADQQGVADIVVTAERRTSNVQRTATSVSVRTGDELRKEGKFTLRDILENVPGVVGGEVPNSQGTDTLGGGITIRGLSSNQGAAGSVTSVAAAVAIYTDDIYEGIGNNYDVDRVEILRGPQGTLYGRSATAGVVAVHTRDPDLSDWGGLGLAELGDYNLRHFTAALNAPIIDDKLGLRVAGDYYNRDGFNSADGLGRSVSKNARAKLLAKPTDRLSILIGGALQYNDIGSGGSSPRLDANGNRYFAPTDIGSGSNRFHEAWANVQWDLGFATLTYIPAYRGWHSTTLTIARTPDFTISQPSMTPTDDFITNEVRLSSNDSTRFKWQAGAFQYHNFLTNTNTVNIVLAGVPPLLAFSSDTTKRTNALGVFGEGTYSLTDAWRVTAGLRYDYTKVEVTEVYSTGPVPGPPGTEILSGDAGRRKFNDWTYKLRTEYDLSPRNLVYLSYSTSFSPGDVSLTTDVNGQPTALELKDETVKALEFGTKNRFLNGKIQANGSIYFYDYSGYQNQGIDIDRGPGLAFTTLVSPQHTLGGEIELVYQPGPRDRIALDLSYVNARYVNRSAIFQSNIIDRETLGVQPFTANLSYSHRFDLAGGSSFTVTGDGRYLSAHQVGFVNDDQATLEYLARQPGAAIANLNATWTSADRKFSLGGYVRNITSNRYILSSGITGSSSNPAADRSATLQIYEPRTFGFVGQFNF